MTDKTEIQIDEEPILLGGGQAKLKLQILRVIGYVGLAIAAPFFLWVPLGLTGLVPSMIDVFGIVGLRFPASFTIAGLLLSAVGFHQV
jgi:hypothetical protein